MSQLLSSFERQVDDWVRGCIENKMVDFEQIVVELPGVYPTIVRESLNRLVSQGHVSYSLREEKFKSGKKIACNHKFPNTLCTRSPHPLDYDWRFSKESIELLSSYSDTLTLSNDKVVFLGTPSLFEFSSSLLPKRNVVLIDKNPPGFQGKNRKYYPLDLMKDDLPRLTAKLVVADPPWYPDYTFMFLWSAAKICKKGGHVLFCMPTVGTRPGIKRELHEALEWAHKLGLECVGYKQSIIAYTSPLFERNALKKEGIENIPENWRHGDLALFRKTIRREVTRPLTFTDDDWIEVILKGVVFKVRSQSHSTYQDPSLKSIIPGDILPSVSRRDPRRNFVDVWTSGNRIFSSGGTNILIEILKALSSESSSIERVSGLIGRELKPQESNEIMSTVRQIKDLITLERKEQLAIHQENVVNNELPN